MIGRKLKDVASVIRSKNAGPLLLTLDVILPDKVTFDQVVAAGVLAPERMAELYQVSHNEVSVIPFVQALAIKITLPRRYRSGGPLDSDVYGAQQHVPLFDLEI